MDSAHSIPIADLVIAALLVILFMGMEAFVTWLVYGKRFRSWRGWR